MMVHIATPIKAIMDDVATAADDTAAPSGSNGFKEVDFDYMAREFMLAARNRARESPEFAEAYNVEVRAMDDYLRPRGHRVPPICRMPREPDETAAILKFAFIFNSDRFDECVDVIDGRPNRSESLIDIRREARLAWAADAL